MSEFEMSEGEGRTWTRAGVGVGTLVKWSHANLSSPTFTMHSCTFKCVCTSEAAAASSEQYSEQ